jgi:hypothetical protein
MAPHTLLIERAESTGPVTGGRIAFTRIKPLVTRGWEISRAELASEIGCPPEAVRFNRVGPIYLAHGREWAESRELDSLCWKLLYPALLHIRGRALAVRPAEQADPWRQRQWRALTEWEAINARAVLQRFAEPLTPCAAERWDGIKGRIYGQWAQRFYLADPGWPQECALIAFARHEAGLRQLQRGLQAVAAG